MTAIKISRIFDQQSNFILWEGNCLNLLAQIPDEFVQLVVTSPPYNLGKPYESRIDLNEYLYQQKLIIQECIRVLKPSGSICWQIGYYVDNGEILPLHTLLY